MFVKNQAPSGVKWGGSQCQGKKGHKFKNSSDPVYYWVNQFYKLHQRSLSCANWETLSPQSLRIQIIKKKQCYVHRMLCPHYADWGGQWGRLSLVFLNMY